ncbi:hypothetical protein MMC25_001870 [Agyrium rufum]|nr:hypothetical protein [Agyrium rufum]
MVDYILGSSYDEIDLNETPCMFPKCGHVLTVESMDGQVGMGDYYTLNAEGNIVGLGKGSTASAHSKCGTCRGSLRNIERYARLSKQIRLNQATKKFIVWANAQYLILHGDFSNLEAGFQTVADGDNASTSKFTFPRTMSSMASGLIKLDGNPDVIIQGLRRYLSDSNELWQLIDLRSRINAYSRAVGEAEQPFGKIVDLVKSARLREGTATKLMTGPEVLQTKYRPLALVLLLRLDHLLLSQAGRALQKLRQDSQGREILPLDLSTFRHSCTSLIVESKDRKQTAAEVEASIFYGLFVALERNLCNHTTEALAETVESARTQLDMAEALCKEYSGTTAGLLSDIEDTRRLLGESTFYTPVSNEEREEVYRAMASEFRGTGHWYYCVNGHPFTIGECGMPMEESRCPQCGEAVGGAHHEAAEGVRRAEDLDGQFARMRV